MIVLDYSSEFQWLKVQYFFIKFQFMPYLFLVQHVLFAIKVWLHFCFAPEERLFLAQQQVRYLLL